MTEDRSLCDAAEYWRSGRPLDAGRLLYKSLSPGQRPVWAGKMLKLAIQGSGLRSPAVDDVVRVAENLQVLHEAHAAFSAVRKQILRLERLELLTPHDQILQRLLYLAEVVAKVAYNATNPDDEFDEDSGWWVAVNLHSICELLQDSKFSYKVWSLLSGAEA